MSAPHRPPHFRDELNATLRLTAPLALAQLAQIGMGLTDTVMLGALGRDALAAGGLGANMFFTIAALLQGLVMGVGILVAHARGANDHARIAPVLRAGLGLAASTALPLMVLMWNAEPLLVLIGEPAQLAHSVTRYDRILLFAAPATLWLGAQRSYLAAVGHPRVVMIVAVSGLFANGLLNYALIHGAWGFPEMGYLGSATATLITLWAAMIATGLGIRAVSKEHRLKGPIDWHIVAELANLGWPIAVTMGVELLLFMVASLMMGTLGPAALAAHQVTLSVASLTFMVPLAAAQAANVRVGFHMGAEMPHAARRAAFAAFILGVGFMMLSAATMFIAPRQIALLFNLKPDNTADAEVIALVVRLMTICAVFQVFDGAQTIAAGALRGMKDTRVPMMLAGFGYWAVGFPVAWVFGFPLGTGAEGIWYGLAVGLAAAAVVLNVRFWRLSQRKLALTPSIA